ncbi:phosphoribosylaminoimidazolesuccinocarboxamide synthase [Mumia sp. zg.B21]|uniref:phosphoribosylaminoimidazolesuccinocarboxamide synthase n=1 Tax=Mumia sp. zg.B21 TaxID=2855447 RepID=UPI001C6EEFF4|nr:phosphoribosylaminoimidazolesuccinocarboxamide synthase [Mumia sp. zg.B21]MBW9210331.1 phosphoribosylaminoimidazolesuccinocarboxamide synthase [Mumia sp. zg.B21]
MTAPYAVPGATHVYSGKVRDLYELDNGSLLMVASDRISAYDHALDPPIPDKGEILTRMSLWWFDQLRDVAPNHVISTDVPDVVAGRAIEVERLDMVQVECIARGYLTGSGLSDYRATGVVSGIVLPDGLTDGSPLPEPIFTPSTKAAYGGHDEPISYEQVAGLVGEDLAAQLRDLTLEVYRRGEAIARERGIIVADTKIEIGLRSDGTLVLADELLTPDSSRFWPADRWEPGHVQPSYDKQFVRDWLTSSESGWDRAGDSAPPRLPDDVVEKTRARYVEAYETLTGETF